MDLKTVEPWQRRVCKERVELGDKLAALDTMMLSAKFDSLAPEDKGLLRLQQKAMLHYINILDARISRFNK